MSTNIDYYRLASNVCISQCIRCVHITMYPMCARELMTVITRMYVASHKTSIVDPRASADWRPKRTRLLATVGPRAANRHLQSVCGYFWPSVRGGMLLPTSPPGPTRAQAPTRDRRSESGKRNKEGRTKPSSRTKLRNQLHRGVPRHAPTQPNPTPHRP